MQKFLRGFLIAFVAAGIISGIILFSVKLAEENYADVSSSAGEQVKHISKKPPKTKEELIAEALEKSKDIRGLYMTGDVAFDQGVGATRRRNQIIKIAEETEINGIVIDVKEVCGPDYNETAAKKLIQELHEKNIWAIARIAAFKDPSQTEAHPEWYLKRAASKVTEDQCAHKRYLIEKNPQGKNSTIIFWRDRKGGYWLDPASEGTRQYLAEFAK